MVQDEYHVLRDMGAMKIAHDRETTDHRARVQIEYSAEVQADHTKVQIEEKPKRRIMRPTYL